MCHLAFRCGYGSALQKKKKKNRISKNGCKYALFAVSLFACTPPTVPVSRSFGLRSSYEIDILDTD